MSSLSAIVAPFQMAFMSVGVLLTARRGYRRT
jgi:hypothetical protein